MVFKKGHKINVGRKFNTERNRKISKSRKNMVFTKNHIHNLSLAHKGQHSSPETEFKNGMTPWNKDKKGVMPVPWNKDTKGICKANSGSFKKGSKVNLGRKRPDASIRMRKLRMTLRYPTKDTSIERKLFVELALRKIPFEKHKSILDRTQPDAFIEPNICVYADGKYWHSLPGNIACDKRANEMLPKAGFLVLRYGEDEINQNAEGVVDEIEDIYVGCLKR